MDFLNTKDVAKIMGVSLPTAREIMRRKDFPLVKAGKNYKVSREAFEAWSKERHI